MYLFSLSSVLQLHVVHYNSDKYKSFQEASDKPDGLAVLAFFYEVRSEDRLFIFLFVFYILLVVFQYMNSEQMTHRTALWVTGPVPPGPVPPGPVPPVITFDSIIVLDILPARLMGPLIGRLRAVWPAEGKLASRDGNKWQAISQPVS